jgi:hypothetical protein
MAAQARAACGISGLVRRVAEDLDAGRRPLWLTAEALYTAIEARREHAVGWDPDADVRVGWLREVREDLRAHVAIRRNGEREWLARGLAGMDGGLFGSVCGKAAAAGERGDA